MTAPAGSYLILGRPRSRTAWLSALLYRDPPGVPCYHDRMHQLTEWVAAGKPFGWSAPSAPMMAINYLARVYQSAPIVVIGRPAEECFQSLERFTGLEFESQAIERYEKRFQALLDRLPADRTLSIPYSGLDEYETVDRVHRHCLGWPLDRDRYHTFNLLRIEQHLPKVIDDTPATLFRRS